MCVRHFEMLTKRQNLRRETLAAAKSRVWGLRISRILFSTWPCWSQILGNHQRSLDSDQVPSTFASFGHCVVVDLFEVAWNSPNSQQLLQISLQYYWILFCVNTSTAKTITISNWFSHLGSGDETTTRQWSKNSSSLKGFITWVKRSNLSRSSGKFFETKCWTTFAGCQFPILWQPYLNHGQFCLPFPSEKGETGDSCHAIRFVGTERVLRYQKMSHHIFQHQGCPLRWRPQTTPWICDKSAQTEDDWSQIDKMLPIDDVQKKLQQSTSQPLPMHTWDDYKTKQHNRLMKHSARWTWKTNMTVFRGISFQKWAF